MGSIIIIIIAIIIKVRFLCLMAYQPLWAIQG